MPLTTGSVAQGTRTRRRRGTRLGGPVHLDALDLQQLLSASGDGSDRLPGAVPILLKPGDCFIQSRTALHGAFANMSDEPRCTFQFGFNKRATVHNITTKGYGFSKWCAQRRFSLARF